MPFIVTFIVLIVFSVSVQAKGRSIKVFVALCDNATQNIAKVGKSIGDGDKPEANLYWGTYEALPHVFGKSKIWNKVSSRKEISHAVMREIKMRHTGNQSELTALAYRGSSMKQCYIDFEAAVASGKYDLVCYIGHTALMDMPSPKLVKPSPGNDTDVVVLSCLSDSYCSARIRKLGAKPILMTRSLMYPGAFILHDALIVWSINTSNLQGIRSAAGKAYYKNQVKINKRLTLANATHVFKLLK